MRLLALLLLLLASPALAAPSVARRAKHYTDYIDDISKPHKKRRRLKKNANFRKPIPGDINTLGPWQETDQTISAASGPPAHWQGNFDFQYQALGGPLQAFVGDSTTPLQTALFGVREARRPRNWVNWKALNVNNGATMTVFGPQKSVRWSELWDNVDLFIQLTPLAMNKIIKIKSSPYQAAYRFAMRIPATHSWELANNQISIKNGLGATVMQTALPYGWDSSDGGTITTPGVLSKHIAATLTQGADVSVGQKTFPTFWITPDPTDMASATLPVFIDPSVQLSGTTDIEDNWITNDDSGSDGDNDNNGGSVYGGIGVNQNRYTYRQLIRIDESVLPTDVTFTAATVNVYGTLKGNVGTFSGDSFKISTANAGWVEGTASSASSSGTSCFIDHTWNNIQEWAGSIGLGTATTDYDASGTGWTLNLVTGTWQTISWDPQWLADWQATPASNAGVLMRADVDVDPEDVTGGTTYFFWASTEDSSNQMTIDIDYTEGGAGAFFLMNGF